MLFCLWNFSLNSGEKYERREKSNENAKKKKKKKMVEKNSIFKKLHRTVSGILKRGKFGWETVVECKVGKQNNGQMWKWNYLKQFTVTNAIAEKRLFSWCHASKNYFIFSWPFYFFFSDSFIWLFFYFSYSYLAFFSTRLFSSLFSSSRQIHKNFDIKKVQKRGKNSAFWFQF